MTEKSKNKKGGRFSYNEEERVRNRIFKMQKDEIEDIAKKSDSLQSDIDDLKESTSQQQDDIDTLFKRIEKLKESARKMADTQGIKMPNESKISFTSTQIEEEDNTPYLADMKIKQEDIPSWEQVVNKANEYVPEEVVLEDLLSQEEFNYCIEDVERINREFSEKTKLNKTDIVFLMVASALQTARWIIIQQICGDLGETINAEERLEHNDKIIKDKVSSLNKKFQNQFEGHGHRPSERYKSWEQIIFSSVPYDTTIGSPDLGINMEGRYHRYRTLGHDPILGWIFGTANIITDTITLNDFSSYEIVRKGGPRFGAPILTPTIFYNSFMSIKEDYLRLPAAIFAQYVHLKSDVFTKLGLPVPLLETFSEEMAGKLYRSQYDSLCLMRDLIIVGKQAGFAILINMIIGLVHGLFYNKEKDGSRDHYEVRTRKILLYSNAISSGLNLAYVGANAYTGNWTEALKKLDLGGLLVSLWRLFTDVRFITKVKDQFIKQEMEKVTRSSLEDLNAMFEQYI